MPITDVVLDFDGTCTQIPVIYEAYLDRYLVELNKRVFTANPVTPEQWRDAQQVVRDHSPKAAWSISTAPAAPAAADPYILAFESVKIISKKLTGAVIEAPYECHRDANDAHPAPWRPEAKEVFEMLLNKGIKVHFISNSSSTKITQRLTDLLNVSKLPAGLKVQSDANKFRISELAMDSNISESARKQFESIPAVYPSSTIGRPIYLRRGYYFEAICKVFDDLNKLKTSVFCGDIWEMDLAMPAELGAYVHLIERAAPFETYSFEREGVVKVGEKGKVSEDLRGLGQW